MDDAHKHSPLLTADSVSHANVCAYDGDEFIICPMADFFSQQQYYSNNAILTDESLYQITVLKTLETDSDLYSMIGKGGEGSEYQLPSSK
jgi:hypothetical protein